MTGKIAHFIAGILIYGVSGALILLVSGDEIENKWRFIAFWAVMMTLSEMFILTPLLKYFEARKRSKQQ